MRLVIDAQALQSKGSRHRGIGRYSLALLQEMAQQAGDHQIILLLNGLYSDSLEPIRQSFQGLIPEGNFRIWLPLPLCGALESPDAGRRQAGELIRESVIASLKPDVVLLLSLFEGLDESVITSVGRHKGGFPTATIVYDLIPYIFKETYLENTLVNSWYHNKIDDLRRSDLILSISECTKSDIVKHLKISEDIIINISGSVADYFRPKDSGALPCDNIRSKFGITRHFIMYTGGADHRKNLDGLLNAYIALPDQLHKQHQLVIVCFLDEIYYQKLMGEIENSNLGADDVVLTGRISDDDLLHLYQSCKLFVFPSIYEGFGLPALEAMRCGAPVITSNTSSLPEIVGSKEAMFDPNSRAAMTAAMQKALEDNDFRFHLAMQGLGRSREFSWAKSAQTAWTALASLVQKQPHKMESSPAYSRQRLAYVSPLPPIRSGIAKYSTDILPELSRFYDIDLIVDQDIVVDPWVMGNARVRSVSWLRQNIHKIDRVIYQFGNSVFHQYMFDLLIDIPGTTVLHDFGFGSLRAHLEETGEQRGVWSNALEYSHGWRVLYERHKKNISLSDSIWFPVNLDIIQQSTGVIVHSKYANRMAKEYFGENTTSNFEIVPFPCCPIDLPDREEARSSLGWGTEEIAICCFGFVAESKLNHLVLEAWLSSDILQSLSSRLIFVGEAKYDYGEKFLKKVADINLSDRLTVTGWTDDESYRHYLAAADFAVQLRGHSRGESSAAVFDCLTVGLPLIVNAKGSFAELPADSIVQLTEAVSVDALRAAMERLALDPVERRRLRTAGSRLAAAQHSPAVTAAAYRDAIERFHAQAQNGAVGVISALSRIPDFQGSSEERDDLAQALAVSFPASVPYRRIWLDVATLESLPYAKRLSLLAKLMLEAPQSWKVEPIEQHTQPGGWRRAKRLIAEALEVPSVADLVPEPNEHDLVIVGDDVLPKLLHPLCNGGGRLVKWNGPNEPLPYPL